MNTTGKILQLTPAHLDFSQVLDLDQEEFPRPWTAKEWGSLNWNHHALYGRKTGSKIIAYALFSTVSGDDLSHLLKICVKSDHRGQGTSLDFWQACRSSLKAHGTKSIYLEVESHNVRALAFYRKVGFQTLRTIKSYYSDGADAITMQMTI